MGYFGILARKNREQRQTKVLVSRSFSAADGHREDHFGSRGSIMAGRGRMPRYPVHDEMRGYHDAPPPLLPRGRGAMPPPLLPIEEELAIGHDKIRRLLSDNRLLIDENIAMKREIDTAREELHALGQVIPKIRTEKEAKARELIQMGLKLEADLRALEPLKAEAMELRSEAKRLDALRQEMSTKVQNMSQDLKRLQSENKQIPNLRMEIEGLHQDLVRVRASCEFEQKAHVELSKQRKAMENDLISMAREGEKLRAEQVILENRARGSGLGAYGSDTGYTGSYGDGYGRDKGGYGVGSWGSYEPRGFPHH